MKMLIAEDETPIREGLKKVIPWSNYNINEIYTAKDGKEALDLCLQYKPDILFLLLSNWFALQSKLLIRRLN